MVVHLSVKVICMKALSGIILFASGIVLLLAFVLTPSLMSEDLRDIFLLFPGVLFVMSGPIVAYAWWPARRKF